MSPRYSRHEPAPVPADFETHEECDECGGCGYVAVHEATGERLECAECEGHGALPIAREPSPPKPAWYVEALAKAS